MDHCPLCQYLHCFKNAATLTCLACHQKDETVEHYLLHCSVFEGERRELAKAVDLGVGALSKLLGNTKSVKALFQYINCMGQFKRTYGELSITDNMSITKQGRGRKGRWGREENESYHHTNL